MNAQKEVDERTNLTSNSKFEMLLFRLGEATSNANRELFGINVFKVREIMVMPSVTAVAASHPHLLGVADIRGQVIPVINLSAVVGCTPNKGLGILLVTEYARTTQAFAVEEVDEIVRVEWRQVLSAEGSTSSGGLITSIARVDGDAVDTRLAQVLDVEHILRQVLPSTDAETSAAEMGGKLAIAHGKTIVAADDSPMARSLIEKSLHLIEAPFTVTKSGSEAWAKLEAIAADAERQGLVAADKIALVLTDLEMPEMDGFTLTRKIKQDPRFCSIPVVIHSSLSGSTNEEHVRSVGADAYVGKFVAGELAETIRRAMRGKSV